MSKRMLIDATHAEETRVVVLDGNRLEDFDVETSTKRHLKGNIYLAKVVRVEPSLQAAFVEYGGGRHGFLAFGEIHPDYYQIPVADRQRLVAMQAEEARRDEEEEDRAAAADAAREARRPPAAAPAATPVPDPVSGTDHDPVSAVVPETIPSVYEAEATASGTVAVEQEVSASVAQPAAIPQETIVAPLFDAAEPWPAAAEAAVDSDSDSDTETRVSADAAPDDAPPPDVADETIAVETLGSADDEAAPAVAGMGDVAEAADFADAGDVAEMGEAAAAETAPPETVGGDGEGDGEASEDARDRRIPPHYLRNYKIQEVIHRRQILLVQVVKEERGTKGAALTTYLSLAGRFSVLMPNSPRGGGISRKITSAADRRRLKEITAELDLPSGMGIIVRTAGANRPKPEIRRDCEYLLRLWDDIRDHTMQSVAPSLIYEEASLIKRAIRDVYSRDLDEIVVDGEEGWRAARDFMRMMMPSHAKKVQLWQDGGQSLLSRYQVDSQLDAMLQPVVQLRSGGYLVINQTEALVAIDVNSGRSTRERGIEETALRTNLEAADEVARQLRLRDLAGLVVIDFIDMESKKNNAAVERRIKEALKNDRARIQVGSISHFGLLEMSRQRLRPSLAETSFVPCPHCDGTGHVRSTESAAIHVLRQIEEEGAKRRTAEVLVHAASSVALYVLNNKRGRLAEIERRHGLSVSFAADDALIPPQVRIDRVRTASPSELPPVVTPNARLIDPIDDAEIEADEVVFDEPAAEPAGEAAAANGATAPAGAEPAPSASTASGGEEESEERKRRKRRRRRRGGRRGEEGGEEAAAGAADDADEGETAEAAAPGGTTDGEGPWHIEGAPDMLEPAAAGAASQEQAGREQAAAGEAVGANGHDTASPLAAAPSPAPFGAEEAGVAADAAGAEPARRTRSRRGGRRRRDATAEDAVPPVAEPGAEQPEIPYAGPTPANPFGGQSFDIFEFMDNPDLIASAAPPRAAAELSGAEPVVRPADPPPPTEMADAAAAGTAPVEPAQAEVSAPGLPLAEPPPAEPSLAEPSMAELPLTELPLAEPPLAEAPQVEASRAETPVAEAPAVEAPAVEAPAVGEPAVGEPAVGEPAVGEPAAAAAPDPVEEPASAAVRPIIVGAETEPVVEKKRGWWRR